MNFLVTFLINCALVALLAVPVLWMAYRRSRLDLVRNYAIAVALVGLFFAFLRASSERLVSQCENAGNTQCFDAGSTGIIVISLIIFAVVAWLKAWSLRVG